jgi:hypothetical protein
MATERGSPLIFSTLPSLDEGDVPLIETLVDDAGVRKAVALLLFPSARTP